MVESTDGGLSLKVSLDTSDLDKDAEKLKAKLSKTQTDINSQLDKLRGKVSDSSKRIINDSLEGFGQLDGAYRRIFTNIQLYQSQLEKLARAEKELASLRKSGSITQGEYNVQVTALRQQAFEAQKAVKGLVDQLRQLNKPVKVEGLSKESVETISRASKSFNELAPNIQNGINKLVILENEFENLRKAEADLEAQLSKGTITLAQYNQGVSGIRASMLNARAELKKTAMEVELNRSALSGRNLNQGWDGLGNSIAQISRELPAFTFSAQTGFLAISNNIPILADEIGRLQKQNAALTASGQKAVPVWKQVLGGFISWQTLIPVLLTLLTVYGKEIGEFVKGLFGVKKGFDDLKVSQEALNKAFEDTSFGNAIEEIIELRTNLELAKQGFIDKDGVIKQYNDSIGKVTKEVKNLNEVEEGLNQNADNFVQATLYKAAALAAQEEIAKEMVELARKEQRLEDEITQALADNVEERNRLGERDYAMSNVTGSKLKKLYEELAEVRNDSETIADSGVSLVSKLKKLSLGTGLNLIKSEDLEIKEIPKQVVDARRDLLQKIADLDREYARMQISENEAEIDALREKFDKIRDLVTKFNADPRNAQVQIQVETLNEIQAEAEKGLIFKQETESLSQEYEKRKVLFQEYESFVRDFGVDAAQKRYGQELDLAKDYLGRIQAEYDKINTIPAEDRSGSQNERLKLFKRILDQETIEQEQAYFQLVRAAQNYNQQRTILEQNYQKDRAEIIKRGDLEYLEEFDKQYQIAIQKLNQSAFEDNSGFDRFFDNIQTMSRKAALEGVAVLREELNRLVNLNPEEGGISPEYFEKINRALDGVVNSIEKEVPQAMMQWASSLDDIAGSLGGVSDQLAQIIGSVSEAVRGFAQIKTLMADMKLARESGDQAGEITATAGLIAAAATSLIGIFNFVSKAAKQRKEAEERYYKSIIGLQKDYNLSLNEQMRIQSSLRSNVFMTDYQGQLEDGYSALLDAEGKYQDALEKLADARAKIGTRNKIDLGSTAGSTALGAIAGTAIGAIATGAAIGSIVPGIGTIIGAGVGAIIGLFATKKKKDTYGSLLEEFPELVKQGTNGILEINEELANALIANELLDEKTKELVQDTLNWGEAVKQAREQIAGVIGELVGQIGGDLQSSLVNAFRSGEDAAMAMVDSVESAIEKMISSLLFSAIFKDEFDKLQSQLTDSLDPLGGDQNVLDDFQTFYQTMADKLPVWEDALKSAQNAGTQFGFDLFQADKALSQQKGLSGAIRRELTEETAGELAGLFRGQFDISKRHFQVAQDQLGLQIRIEQNTFVTAQKMGEAVFRLEKIEKNTDPANARASGYDG